MNRREFTRCLSGGGLGLAASGAAWAQGGPVEGKDYVRLASPAPVSLPSPDKKVDVVEFFWYGCPHCNTVEPLLDNWSKRLAPDVSFRKVHVGFGQIHQVHQRLFYALDEMGLLPPPGHRVGHERLHEGKRCRSGQVPRNLQVLRRQHEVDARAPAHRRL
jgi:thiol:disulfide interchange protein DsbA